MIPDDIGQRLHDRRTRGEPLTADEQSNLLRWYEEKDRDESAALDAPTADGMPALRRQVHETLREIRTAADAIEQLTRDNPAIAGENAELLRFGQ